MASNQTRPRLEAVSVPDGAPADAREAGDSDFGGGAITDAEARAMQRAIVRLFALWKLTDAEACILLGGIGARSYARWKAGTFGRAGVDLKARLSNLIAIHKALRLLFDDAGRAYGWIKRPNDAFAGRSALEIMLGGELTDLMRVRRYLDASRGVW